MHKGKKLLVLAMAVLMMALASCATEKPAPQPEPQPEVTKTTTLPPPAPTPVVTETPQTAVAQPEPAAAPSVSEIELRNLFGQANGLKIEAGEKGISSVLPEKYAALDADFASVTAEYNSVVDVAYDGVKAFPLKAKLENSAAAWESLIAEGAPLRADAERELAVTKEAEALSADAGTLAPERLEGAQAMLADADAAAQAGTYDIAVSGYQQAAAAYDVAVQKSKANALRGKIFSNGYAKYSGNYFQMAEEKYQAEEELWASGTTGDLKDGSALLADANGYYDFVAAKGAEYKSFEGKDRALAAQTKAVEDGADINAPEEYASAVDILTEAQTNQAAGNYESAYLWYGDAAEAFGAASDASQARGAETEAAIAEADAAVKASAERSDAAGVEKNIYLDEAESYLIAARTQQETMAYADATMNANEAKNYAALSDTYVAKEEERAAAEEAAALAKAKAAADPAMADARTRIVWAENNELGTDHPTEYKNATSLMTAAEKAYANEKYAPAQYMAEDTSEILSDSFQAKVLADRKAAAEEKAKLEALAADKAAAKIEAEKAQADAQARMAWANENKISADYPAEYKTASSAMIGSFVAYGNEDYLGSIAKSKEVNSTLSDEFQARVGAERQAAAEEKARLDALAADKAAADPAMSDARTRITWAENNEIATDYPSQYKQATSAMTAAEMAYSNEKYQPAKTLANEVSTTLSDDFQKKVIADRAAATQPAVTPAAEGQATDAESAATEWVDETPVAPLTPPAPAATQTPVSQTPVSPTDAAPTADQTAALKAGAQTDLDAAKKRLDWAAGINAANNYPAQYYKAAGEYDAATFAFGQGLYANAGEKARQSYASLEGVTEFAPLPAKYVVRLIPSRRDCLWRIAEYPFIYNNPLKWPVLYEANKKTFKDPSNPDLIFPDQVLVIPSIKGETREGTWDPAKTYKPLAR